MRESKQVVIFLRSERTSSTRLGIKRQKGATYCPLTVLCASRHQLHTTDSVHKIREADAQRISKCFN